MRRWVLANQAASSQEEQYPTGMLKPQSPFDKDETGPEGEGVQTVSDGCKNKPWHGKKCKSPFLQNNKISLFN